jgi:hypothetical protein
MDGTHDSIVSSEYEEWDCTLCDPVQYDAEGVTKHVGGNGNSNLWQSPAPRIDFTIINQHFNNLKVMHRQVIDTTALLAKKDIGLSCRMMEPWIFTS